MILLKIDGIDGNANIKDHEKWIKCATVNWNIGRNIPSKSGETMDRTRDVVHAGEVIVTKKMDSSSARLFEAAGGTEGKKVEIHFLSGAGKEATTYAEWTLENTLVSNYDIQATDEDAVETLSLNFTKIEVKSIEKGPDEKVGSPYPVTFDREKGVLGG